MNRFIKFLNNLPKDKDVNCVVGPVKALPMAPLTISKPALTIGDETVVFPVKMESGMFLEFMSPDDCVLYGSKGEFIQKVAIKGNVPFLKTGKNDVSFTCEGPEGINPRVQVTVIGEGNPI
jgi:hypothetical protein